MSDQTPGVGRRVGDFLRQTGREAWHQSRGNILVGMGSEGYGVASRVCIAAIDGQLEALHKKAAAGNLTKAEQPVMAALVELKKEMETRLELEWPRFEGYLRSQVE